jgi:NAD(P)-dependent dehydrogenase (short-subunit alcohol dehydrogenase family)
VVTGASRGIGRAIALDLASHGTSVVLCARTQSELDATEAAIRDAYRVDVRSYVVDVSDVAQIAEVARRCELDLSVVGLVNCAGVLGPVGRIDQVDMHRWLEAVTVDLVGTAAMCAALAPQMIRAGGGSIVNFSGGGVGGPGLVARISAYTASKAAVVALSESLAIEFASTGLRVNAVAPGPVPTGFMKEVLDGGPDLAGEGLYRQTVEQQDAAPALDPVLDLVRYLLSAESAHITGRFLSARWERPADLDAASVAGSLYTMRRIDGDLFAPVEKQAAP